MAIAGLLSVGGLRTLTVRVNIPPVSTIEEIEKAIERLPEAEVKSLASWFDAYREKLWDAKMESDAQGGKLDFLLEEARHERASGTLRRFP